jgi:hypothetical protein
MDSTTLIIYKHKVRSVDPDVKASLGSLTTEKQKLCKIPVIVIDFRWD